MDCLEIHYIFDCKPRLIKFLFIISCGYWSMAAYNQGRLSFPIFLLYWTVQMTLSPSLSTFCRPSSVSHAILFGITSSQEGLWRTEGSYSSHSQASLPGLPTNAKRASTRKYLRCLGDLCSSGAYNQGRLTLNFDTISCGLLSRAANNRVNTVHTYSSRSSTWIVLTL